MDLYNLFTTTDYTFLELASTSAGNGVVQEYAANGIVKYRDGLTQGPNAEAYDSSATVHIRPDEPFISAVGGHLGLVGHGIRAGGDDYRIEGVRVGTDFDNGTTAFYLCTLKKTSLWASALPLE